MRWPNQLAGVAVVALAGVSSALAMMDGMFPKAGYPDKTAARPRIAVPFVENAGQMEPGVRFRATMGRGAMFITADARQVYAQRDGSTVIERYVGTVQPDGESPRVTRISSFIGNDPAAHRTGIRTFDAVALGEVFPGIDVRLAATARNVEKIFTVRPGADPAAIAMEFDGDATLRVDAEGALRVATSDGEIGFTPPVAFQEIRGTRIPVRVAYAIDAAKNRYGFALGDYDRTQPLIIDPLIQSTFIGGNDDDLPNAIAVHPTTGDVIVAGNTKSTNLPCTVAGGGCANAPQTTHAADEGKDDGFIARFSADLTQLKQVTYFGGLGIDELRAMAIHPITGDVVIAGYTKSTDLPCTVAGGTCANGAQPAHGTGSDDGFIARFSTDLTQLKQATYLGGSGFDSVNALAINPANGEIVVGGWTTSSNFPCTSASTPGCIASILPRQSDGLLGDGFISRLSADLTKVLQSAYYGGAGQDIIRAVAVHPVLDQIFAAGITDSQPLFCVTSGLGCRPGAQATKGQGVDGFVVAFNSQASGVRQATYFGGDGTDHIYTMAIAPDNGDILIGGITTSNNLPCHTHSFGCFPGAQDTIRGSFDGFVARVASDLMRFRQTTYVGGTFTQQVTAVAVHPATGEVYAAGETTSTDLYCTTAASGGSCQPAVQSDHGAGFFTTDAFVARYGSDLRSLRQATYLGAGYRDSARAIAFHPQSGDVMIAGATQSPDFPGTAGGARPTHNDPSGSLYDGFVSRLTADLTLADTTPAPLVFPPVNNAPLLTQITSAPAQVTGMTGTIRFYAEGDASRTFCVSSGNNCSCDINGGFNGAVTSVSSGNYVCLRHLSAAAPNQMTQSELHIGGAVGVFRVATGALLGAGAGDCSLDVDGNNVVDPLTDGLLLIRAMVGLTGTAVTSNAVGGNPTRASWQQIRTFLNGNCGTTFGP